MSKREPTLAGPRRAITILCWTYSPRRTIAA